MFVNAVNFRYTGAACVLCGYFSDCGLQSLSIHTLDEAISMDGSAAHNPAWTRTLHAGLDTYFAGVAWDFDDIPVDLGTATDFQKKVWRAARKIPYGQVVAYGDLARDIRQPGAARAVGRALGANPIALIIPCHRVVAAGGALGGYSAGLHWKKYLLAVEKGLANDTARRVQAP